MRNAISVVVIPPINQKHLSSCLFNLSKFQNEHGGIGDLTVIDTGKEKNQAHLEIIQSFRASFPFAYLLTPTTKMLMAAISFRPVWLPCDSIVLGDILSMIANHPKRVGYVTTYHLPQHHHAHLDPCVTVIPQPMLESANENPLISERQAVYWGWDYGCRFIDELAEIDIPAMSGDCIIRLTDNKLNVLWREVHDNEAD